jgi:hypothetical protein
MLDDARRTAAGAKALEPAEGDTQLRTGSNSDRIPASVSVVQASEEDDKVRIPTSRDSDRVPASVVTFEPREDRAPEQPKPVSSVSRRNPGAIPTPRDSDSPHPDDRPAAQRKTISEVLHDIYDEQAG